MSKSYNECMMEVGTLNLSTEEFLKMLKKKERDSIKKFSMIDITTDSKDTDVEVYNTSAETLQKFESERIFPEAKVTSESPIEVTAEAVTATVTEEAAVPTPVEVAEVTEAVTNTVTEEAKVTSESPIEVTAEAVTVTVTEEAKVVPETPVKVAETLASERSIPAPPKEVMHGLVFDEGLFVKDNSTLIDNTAITKKYPEMTKIQDIIRMLGFDCKMSLLYNKIVLCEINNQKTLVVDVHGYFLNKIPKIFLLEDGHYIDQCPAIQLTDTENLKNYLFGKPIVNRPEQVVTAIQRKIASKIVNYGSPIVPEQDTALFENVIVDKVLPFLDKIMANEEYKMCSFRISQYSNPGEWTITCDESTPYRFGFQERDDISVPIHIHAKGYNGDTLTITVDF